MDETTKIATPRNLIHKAETPADWQARKAAAIAEIKAQIAARDTSALTSPED